MAFGVKLSGLMRESAAAVWQMDVSAWWPTGELMKDPRFRVEYSPGYRDYVAILTHEEALDLARRFAARDLLEWTVPFAARLEQLLTDSPTNLVEVKVYEWESGLD